MDVKKAALGQLRTQREKLCIEGKNLSAAVRPDLGPEQKTKRPKRRRGPFKNKSNEKLRLNLAAPEYVPNASVLISMEDELLREATDQDIRSQIEYNDEWTVEPLFCFCFEENVKLLLKPDF